jgi:hypothetical protein
MVRLLFKIKTLKHLGTRERREKGEERGRERSCFCFWIGVVFFRVVERGWCS